MDDAILKRLERLERESRLSRFWRSVSFVLLAGIAAAAVRAEIPGDQQSADGKFGSINAKSITVDQLLVRGTLEVVKSGGNWGGENRITLDVDPSPLLQVVRGSSRIFLDVGGHPAVNLFKGKSQLRMFASDSSGEMEAFDSSGQSIMKFPKPNP
jgi:hypothetical protein